MKSTCLVLAFSLGGVCGAAWGQTSIYGLIDAGLVRESGGSGGSVSKLSSGVASQSRIGFRGKESLGGGMAALFVLEGGIAVDAGTSLQGGALFGRAALVGLDGSLGTLVAGRFFTPYFLTVALADPFGTGYAGSATNIMASTGLRMSNTIKYTTPQLSGFTGELAYGFGEVAGSSGAGRAISAALEYLNGPLRIRFGYHNKNHDVVAAPRTGNARNALLAANYNFGYATGYLAFANNQGARSSPLATENPYGAPVPPVPSASSRDFLLGVSVPAGRGTVLASYVHRKDRTAYHQNACQYAVGYLYALSKRSDLYTAYGRIDNRNGAGYTVGNQTEAGSGNRAFNLGLRQTF